MKCKIPNPIITHNNLVFIKLTKGKWAIVDKESYPKVEMFRWHTHKLSHCCYAESSAWYKGEKQPIPRMANILINPPKGYEVDHINRNGLDNRLSNLRIATRSQNNINRKLTKIKSSIYRGVFWVKSRKKWRVNICIKGKTKHIGDYEIEKEAGLVYDSIAKKEYGEFFTSCAKCLK